MKKIILPVLFLITSHQSFAGYAARPTNPCIKVYYQEQRENSSERKILLERYRQLTGKNFDEKETKKNSAGSAIGALLCPLSAGFAIASAGAGIWAPALFCGAALKGGATVDHAIDKSREPVALEISEEKQLEIDQLTQELNLNDEKLLSGSENQALLSSGEKFYFNAIEVTSRQGHKLDTMVFKGLLSEISFSKTNEFCPNNKGLSHAEVSALVFKKYFQKLENKP